MATRYRYQRLNVRRMCNVEPAELASYLRKHMVEAPDTEIISSNLLQSVAIEAIPPRVYKVWLSVCPDASAIAAGLRQMHSVFCRVGAIKEFRRRFRTGQVSEVWQTLGGATGIVEMMSKWSVNEVKAFCQAVHRSGTALVGRQERQLLVDELVGVLLPDGDEPSEVKNPDQRPLEADYARMVSACTSAFIQRWKDQGRQPAPQVKSLIQSQSMLCTQWCLDLVRDGNPDLEDYLPLLESAMPQPSQANPTITESMSFAIEVLELMLDNGRFPIKENVLCTLVENTVKRLARRKPLDAADPQGLVNTASRRHRASNAITARALQVMSRALQQQAAKTAALTIRYSGYISNLAVLYTREGLDATSDLTTLLRVAKLASHEGTQWLAESLRETTPDKRYDLLKWLLVNVPNYKLDLGQRKAAPSTVPEFHPMLFEVLPPTDAIDLLDTLLRLGLDMRIPGPMRASEDANAINANLLRLSIGVNASTDLNAALKHISRCREKAQTSRDAAVRAFWVEAAFRFAALSRSLDTLNDTLLWARRYNSDSLTIKTAYGSDVMASKHMVEYLAGMQYRAEGIVVRTDLKQRLKQANRTLLFILETAVMCQKDPAFQAHAWQRSLRSMLCNVIESRIRKTNFLVRRSSWTNDDVFQCVWQDTLETLIKAEQICLAEENVVLSMRDLDGLTYPVRVEGIAAKAASLRFLDELAIRRDSLYRTHRIRLNASVIELRDPWPRGLPNQCLQEFIYDGEILDHDTPYLSTRLHSVVFPDAKLAQEPLPQDEDTRFAIGHYVENYKHALYYYVHRAPSLKDTRISETWNHALSHLSDRMTPLEARLYWRAVFHDSQIEIHNDWVELPRPVLPRIPDTDGENVSEWDPLREPQQPELQQRMLPAINLDSMTGQFSSSASLHDSGKKVAFVVPEEKVPAYQAGSFWDVYKDSHLPRSAEEAFIATGLLYIDSRVKSDTSLLSKPFPSGHTQRYPTVFLDESFLNQRALDTNSKGTWARVVLQRFLPDVPTTLLARITMILMRELQEKRGTLPLTAFDVLKMLAYSNKPELAFDHIVTVITDMPDKSSWHRQLLQAGIFKRLPADQARTLASTLTHKIMDKLDEQSRIRAAWEADSAAAKDTASQPSASLVKITTVKMLAELLHNVAFDESFSVYILRSILVRSTHLDIRAAVVSSLVQILSKTTQERTRKAILATLEQYAVPVAASMNERKPMTEQGWLEAETALRLPEVSAERPLQVSMRTTARILSPATLQAVFYLRIMVPLIEASTENNARWTRLFLKKYDVLHLLAYVTPVPTNVMLPVELLHQADPVTASITELVAPQAFEQYSSYVMAVLKAPQSLLEFNKWLREIKLEDSAEARSHWLSQWGGASWSVIHTYEVLDVPKLLRTADWSTTPGTLQLQHAHAHERKVIDIMLRQYDTGAGHWRTQLVRHELRPGEGSEAAKNWALHLKPMLEYMLRRVNETRTPEWQQDPQRVPSILPSTFHIRMRLLPHPGDGIEGSKAERTERAYEFADSVSELLEALAKECTYHVDYNLLKEHLKNKVNQRTTLDVVKRLGLLEAGPHQLPSTAQLLQIDLAQHMLVGSPKPEVDTEINAVREMIDSWIASADEEVRKHGIAALRQLERDWKLASL
nr:hypothetical protein B0A51_08995 [Rachicladosporium sp. CCFEE 5018]